ncbi:Hypothetical protein NTJ_10416 [Nesidiocoris tenuis]|uniref:Uncharacterized protein n=1 Tax=Nesidiocoris tenuis TaxID=355587 RepID=A0ABN7AZL5_9HEMI|nr:Hypothetical protein NTJ_10416 [Nesidiocoris tenuis]
MKKRKTSRRRTVESGDSDLTSGNTPSDLAIVRERVFGFYGTDIAPGTTGENKIRASKPKDCSPDGVVSDEMANAIVTLGYTEGIFRLWILLPIVGGKVFIFRLRSLRCCGGK